MIDDNYDTWVEVVKNKKTKKPKKPKKIIHSYTRQVIKSDFTLTDKEKKIIEEEISKNPELEDKLFCYCCMSGLISDIIRRTFVECGTCYCCAGDDPRFDDEEWVESCVVRFYNIGRYNENYHYTRDDEFS